MVTEFLTHNIIGIYFFYGLSFFSMGLAILLEVGHSELDFAKALRSLAGFGLVHGSHEWFGMFLIIAPLQESNPLYYWVPYFRILLLAISFLFLVDFGVRLISGPGKIGRRLHVIFLICTIWLLGLMGVIYTLPSESNQVVAADVYTRYAIAIPGAALTAWGLLFQRRWFRLQGLPSFGRDVAVAALAFGLYGGIGQLFASPSAIFPSPYLNSDMFIRWFGFPVQLFRAAMACISAVFIIRSLRTFEVENHRRINELREAQLAERQRLVAVRAELLHRTVKAQETERQRIARELHDELGQTLTALGMGLRGLSDTITFNQTRAIQLAKHLEGLTSIGIDGLQRLVKGLHPPQLDDLGLMPAIRWYAGEITNNFDLSVSVKLQGDEPRLSDEVRVVLFRIVQEALNNVIKHACASKASITFESSDQGIDLSIQDNGQGFIVENTLYHDQAHPHWGLLGMMERAALIGATCNIISTPNQGTKVNISLPLREFENV
jgi:signal transduction histidine kinase